MGVTGVWAGGADEEQAVKDIELHVGYDPAATKARFLDAIRRAEAPSGLRPT